MYMSERLHGAKIENEKYECKKWCEVQEGNGI